MCEWSSMEISCTIDTRVHLLEYYFDWVKMTQLEFFKKQENKIFQGGLQNQ